MGGTTILNIHFELQLKLPVRIGVSVDAFGFLESFSFLFLNIAVLLITGVDGLLLVAGTGLELGFDGGDGIRVLISGVLSVLQVSS